MRRFDAMTDVQLARCRRRLYDRAARRLTGGLRYGIDWPTLRICCPGIASEMQAIVTAMQLRRL